MKRIVAAFKGLVEQNKMERKIARVNRAIETARDNARDEIDRLEEKKAQLVESLNVNTEVADIINKLSEIEDKIEEQNAIICRLDSIEEYLEEDIVTEEKEK